MSEFVFKRRQRPVRFTWHTDATGALLRVSDEFYELLGPQSHLILGKTWPELGALLQLKLPSNALDALQRNEGFSGVTLNWPACHSHMRVPLDVSVHPVEDEGEFLGFAGFGVIRSVDAFVAADYVDPLICVADALPTAAKVKETTKATAQTPDSEQELEEEGAGLLSPDMRSASVSGAGADYDLDISEELSEQVFKDAGHDTKPAEPTENRTRPPSPVAVDTSDKENFSTLIARLPDAPQRNAPRDRPKSLAELTSSIVQLVDRGAVPQKPSPSIAHPTPQGEPTPPDVTAVEQKDYDEHSAGVTQSGEVGLLELDDDRLSKPERDAFAKIARALSEEDGTLLSNLTEPKKKKKKGKKKDKEEATAAPLLVSNEKKRETEGTDQSDTDNLAPAKDAAAPDSPKTVPAGEATPTHESELRQLQATLDMIADALVWLDAQGRVMNINRQAEKLFECANEDLQGQIFSYLFAEQDKQAVEGLFEGQSGIGVPSVQREALFVDALADSGTAIPVRAQLIKLPDGDLEERPSSCLLLQDWRQVHANTHLLKTRLATSTQESARKSAYLAEVCHEIRTPMNAIVGFAELLTGPESQRLSKEKQEDYLADILNSSRYVLSLVCDLLDLERIESGKLELHFEAVSLADIAQDCIALMQHQAQLSRVVLRSSIPSALPDVVADPRCIKQILLNLLSNSLKFTPAGGQIICSVGYGADGNLTYSQRDTGIGMNAEALELALQPFKQLEPSASGEGSGLGLPLTKALIEANRAEFSIESQESEGTLVRMIFPTQRVLAD
ncbi:PAS domain-containing sensor histidine kinase [Polycladidibacter hongkongensis]|uniref:PAS domain-containing sensor histidine kinase n=1 Tax=Polycladidibacter hongkongensis TaxID=1647556 RepID=UPI000831CA06|nr:PAS domain-containing sensor histidine kinase [Pseudovibrio hongkongensis]